jgi:hypothetical protein
MDGEEAWALCPGHLERTGKVDSRASWSINTDNGVHNCFSCGFKGNFPQLVTYLLGPRTNVEEWIRTRGGVQVAIQKFRRGGSEPTRVEEPEPISEADLALFEDPPIEARIRRGVSFHACVVYGALWDTDRGHWVYPIRDPQTHALRGWQEKEDGGKAINYPRRVKKRDTFFGINVPGQFDKIVLAEAPVNAMRAWEFTGHWGLASFGAKITSEQIDLLARLNLPVVAAFDPDKAGDIASQTLREEGRGRLRLSYLDYADVNDLDDMNAEQFCQAVDNAIPSYRARL